MTDHIRRADAIDAVAEEWLSEASAESPYVNDNDIDRYRELAEELFADIPSAVAVQGEWQRVDEQPYFRKHYHKVCCSVCHKQGSEKYNFCPNCGARMINKETRK